ncbi:MAG: hypothetical protein J0H44_13555 [Alphaproteobacteria bacterium]|nr:hypothetical protein [Alphaproteobacteria bacterium]
MNHQLVSLSSGETPEWLKSALRPLDEFPVGVNEGDFPPLSMEEFRHAYATFDAVLSGRREAPYLDLIQDSKTGDAVRLEDTLFNRAWIAAGMEFTDEAKRVSFYWRVEQVIGLAVAPEYAAYRNRQAGSMHIALVSAIARVPGSYRTPPADLRAALDKLFRRNLAIMTPGDAGQTH